MHHSRVRAISCRLALIVASAAVTPSTAVTAAADLRTTITVRIYQNAGLRATLERRALAEAGTVLGTARVDVRWEQCSARIASPACDAPPRRSEFLLRIVREGQPRRDGILGTAVVIPGAGGVLATVHANEVSRLASEAGSDPAVLLGRVAAHEIGHLMMQTSMHARRGLMRANWTPCEVRRGFAADWEFTADDLAAMRELGPD